MRIYYCWLLSISEAQKQSTSYLHILVKNIHFANIIIKDIHFQAHHWRQNHKITDTYLTLSFTNMWQWYNITAE